MKAKTIIAAIILGIFLFGCKAPEVQVPAKADDAGATPEGINAFVNSNNQFAFDIYSQLSKDDKNVFVSPWSIVAALGMTYEGARGDTAKEIANVFHFTQPDAERRASFAKLHNLLNEKNDDYKLYTANALWAQEDYKFLDEYLNTASKYYAGKTTNLDFRTKTEESRKTINSWVEDQTNDKIKDLFPQGTLDPMTRLVLTNAIYFKGTWVKEFDKGNTMDSQFYITPDNAVSVPMMQRTDDEAVFNYAEIENLQVLEMLYKGEKLSMLVLLPKGDISSLESKLNAENLAQWRSMLSMQEVKVYMPKFTFETKYFLKDNLAAMGMPLAFTAGDADFSGMDGTKDLYIDIVIHQAFVDVNEEGTEAAAATGVGMRLTAIMEENIFRADHPFIFIIQDRETGNILFMGKVMDPS